MTSSITTARPAVPALNDLSELLAWHVQHRPEQTATGTSDRKTLISYRQLDLLVRSVVAQLSGFGLKRGDTVALVSDNSVEFVVGLLAIVSSGARAAPLNPSLSPPELETRLARLSAVAMLTTRHLAEKLKLAESISCWILDVEGSGSNSQANLVNGRGASPIVESNTDANVTINSRDVALLMFTGGTTGAPKLVPLTHGNIVASIRNIATGCALSPADATLLVMPLFHGHGLIAGLLATLASGGSAYLPSTGAFSAHMFWPDVVSLGVTWYTAVPTIHRILLNRAPKEYPASGAPLRFIRSCSAPLDEELAAAVAATFQAPLISAYGMTETSHQVSSNPLPSDGHNDVMSVGLASGVEIRIVGDGQKDVAPGNVGEIWIRGATVTSGYFNNPEANSTSFVDGWFRSGDLGRRDAGGYLFLNGRLKEMINRAGEKISPGDIDAALLSHPKVLEAAAFGEHDAMYGENVQAAVILRPGMAASEDELKDYCRTQLSAFEVPTRIYIVDDFPRTPKGIADRRALATRFADTGVAGSGPRSAI